MVWLYRILQKQFNDLGLGSKIFIRIPVVFALHLRSSVWDLVASCREVVDCHHLNTPLHPPLSNE